MKQQKNISKQEENKMGIELKKKGEIFIVAVNEQFATTDAMKAKQVFEQLFTLKTEYGDLYQLEKKLEKEKEHKEGKVLLEMGGDIIKRLKEEAEKKGGN